MRSLTLISSGPLAWTEVPEPELAPKGAIIRPLSVSTCDFDRLLTTGSAKLPMPIHIGHECTGEVIAVGEAVDNIRIGDKVIIPFQISCGECRSCTARHSSNCEVVPWLSCYGLGPAGGNWGGAMSDYVMVPYADAMLITLPENFPVHQAPCLTCNIVDAYRCVAPQLQANPGAPVFIATGAFNNIALYAVAIAKVLGASQIDIYGLPQAEHSKAEALGGKIITNKSDVPSNFYPIAVDASKNIDGLNLAIEAASASGVLTVSTMYIDKHTPLPLMTMFQKCLTLITGQPHVRSLIELAIDLVRSNAASFAPMIDEVLPWEEAPRAFSAQHGKRVLVRN